MDRKILEDTGLTPKEVDVYLALISSDQASISDIMNKAKVSRKSIYEILQKLLDKGLVSYTIKDNKKQYTAVTPKKLIDLLKEKEANLETILPELLRKHKESEEEISVRVYIGKEGMKTVLNNILKLEKPYYVIANEDKVLDFLKYFMPQFIKKRKELNIPIKIIHSECIRKKKLKLPLAEIKHLPDEYNTPTTTIICEDNVDMLIFSEENPIAIHIKSKETAQSFMNYFNLMWSIAKK
ncbi:MAG: hypothetical protein DRN71_05710 [Candidatus Nanohalarchaeota archaeon]|nr:MAG: hypothetical protein DRN71_05710 [Candidatus Nanohaloarchaeota archaeon]